MFNRFISSNGRHRRLEGWPLVFTVLTVGAILIGTLVEFAPIFLVGGATEPHPGLEPYTPLELAGREIYIAEGCNNCHSQMVRPFRQEEIRYGPYTRAEETVYETPHLWGSKRTGPDLGRLGGKYPHLWHVRHMENPRSTSPASIMPPYAHMLRKGTDYESLPSQMRGLQRLGIPYTDAQIESAIADARAQAEVIAAEVAEQGGPERLADKQVIALTAYLQSLGTALQGSPAEEDLEPHEVEEIQEVLSDAAPTSRPETEG